MKWSVLVGGNEIEIDSDRLDTARQVEPGVYSVVVDGASYEVRIWRDAQGWSAELNGRKFPIEVLDPRDVRRGSRSALGSGRQSVTAPMPGKVIRVLVSKDDTVETGQGLVVVEAMKMQNEMKALRPGRVVDVLVRDGETIGAGDTLVVLE